MPTTQLFGAAFAGHAFRASGNEKEAAKYENPLTDFVNLMIAQASASIEDPPPQERVHHAPVQRQLDLFHGFAETNGTVENVGRNAEECRE